MPGKEPCSSPAPATVLAGGRRRVPPPAPPAARVPRDRLRGLAAGGVAGFSSVGAAGVAAALPRARLRPPRDPRRRGFLASPPPPWAALPPSPVSGACFEVFTMEMEKRAGLVPAWGSSALMIAPDCWRWLPPWRTPVGRAPALRTRGYCRSHATGLCVNRRETGSGSTGSVAATAPRGKRCPGAPRSCPPSTLSRPPSTHHPPPPALRSFRAGRAPPFN